MSLPPKEVECECGAPATIERESDWCLKCGNRIFYSKKAKTRGKLNDLYTYAAVAGGIMVLVYFFVELILKNL